MNVIASTVTRWGTRIKLYQDCWEKRGSKTIPSSQTRFCCWVSNTCECPREHVHSKCRYQVHTVARTWLASRRCTTCVSLPLVYQVTYMYERYCRYWEYVFYSVNTCRQFGTLCLYDLNLVHKLHENCLHITLKLDYPSQPHTLFSAPTVGPHIQTLGKGRHTYWMVD